LKLLFDQNLSDSLVRQLVDHFPDSSHVRLVGLSQSDDRDVWDYAKQTGMAIVSKDSDFQELSVLLGHPPKVIWIRRGNCSTETISLLLRDHATAIKSFGNDPNTSVLMLL
jgi:predicted nuclease of predicted toxin-antitoxin system